MLMVRAPSLTRRWLRKGYDRQVDCRYSSLDPRGSNCGCMQEVRNEVARDAIDEPGDPPVQGRSGYVALLACNASEKQRHHCNEYQRCGGDRPRRGHASDSAVQRCHWMSVRFGNGDRAYTTPASSCASLWPMTIVTAGSRRRNPAYCMGPTRPGEGTWGVGPAHEAQGDGLSDPRHGAAVAWWRGLCANVCIKGPPNCSNADGDRGCLTGCSVYRSIYCRVAGSVLTGMRRPHARPRPGRKRTGGNRLTVDDDRAGPSRVGETSSTHCTSGGLGPGCFELHSCITVVVEGGVSTTCSPATGRTHHGRGPHDSFSTDAPCCGRALVEGTTATCSLDIPPDEHWDGRPVPIGVDCHHIN